jgi:ribonuclease P protein component
MIAQQFRLKRWRVQKLLKQPDSKKIGFFIVKYIPNKIGHHRWSIIMSRKIDKRASARNLKRRQIYEAIRLIEKEVSSPSHQTHFDVALIPYKQIVTCNYQKIHQNVSDIYKYLASITS